MPWTDAIQLIFFFAILLAAVKPLGNYIANILEGRRVWLDRPLGWLERGFYRLAGVDATHEMGWKEYTLAMLGFNLAGFFFLYFLLRVQSWLPLNPNGFGGVAPDLSFNTAISFVTNTNWQAYGGETTMSYLSQMLGLAVQNFLSAASGIAVMAALIRGIARQSAHTLGNFWVDMTRVMLYLLLPLSAILALLLISQGVVQTLSPTVNATLTQPVADTSGHAVSVQQLAVGPVASQIAIKQLGTNGGGFFNANSAHPFENATPFSNFLELLALLIIPAALTYTFGRMVNDTRQGWALLVTMLVIFIPLMLLCYFAELGGNPGYAPLGVDWQAGNMEGKEVRFGIVNSALWASATTATSCGAVNSMHDSFTPLGGLVPLWLIQLGEIIFGGVGSGIYCMLAFVLVAVFIAGLMVGRTPEYLGKKIEVFEMKMVSLVILVPASVILIGTAIAVMIPSARASVANAGPHGFSEILYAFSSSANNNGSAFAGLNANTWFYNSFLGTAMFLGRFLVKVPILALAGALVVKKKVPMEEGSLSTHTPVFLVLLVGVIGIVGALTFFPALALGPIVEHLLFH